MNCSEEVLSFDCEGERLLGIVSKPAVGSTVAAIGVVVIVGGPQYRAGSHRQFVLMARALASAGFVTLRFDYRGMGDSTGALRDFEHVNLDLAAALDAFQAHSPGVKKFVLWGLCDGASAALLYAGSGHDARLEGLCLLNPWVRSEASLAVTQVKHYYLQRLLQAGFWKKLLSGGVGLQALGELLVKIKLVFGHSSAPTVELGSYQDRMAAGWQGFEGQILLLTCDEDLTAQEFLEFVAASAPWRGVLQRQGLRHLTLAGADHTLSDPRALKLANQMTLDWLAALSGGTARSSYTP
jgi:exosortase A-associated hydrolase 1